MNKSNSISGRGQPRLVSPNASGVTTLNELEGEITIKNTDGNFTVTTEGQDININGNTATPVGTTRIYWDAPANGNWVLRDGSSYAKIGQYAELYQWACNKLQTDDWVSIADHAKFENQGKWGRDDDTAAGNFCVPNDSELFFRMVTDFGTTQEDAFQGHCHQMPHQFNPLVTSNDGTIPAGKGVKNMQLTSEDPLEFSTFGVPRFENETRPKNVSVKVYIKAKSGSATAKINENTFPEWATLSNLKGIGRIEVYPVEMGATAPEIEGTLACDGATYTQAQYPDLFAVIGTTYGTDGAGTFKVPLFQNSIDGKTTCNSPFFRGKGDNSSAYGTEQEDAFQGHWHYGWTSNIAKETGIEGRYNESIPSKYQTPNPCVNDAFQDPTHGEPRVASETRQVNYSQFYVIRYAPVVDNNKVISLNEKQGEVKITSPDSSITVNNSGDDIEIEIKSEFEPGDIIFNSAGTKLKPTEAPCGMGKLTLDKDFFPELAEALGITTQTFEVGIYATDFLRNYPSGFGGHVGQSYKTHHHYNGMADDQTHLFVYGGTTAGMPGYASQSIQSGGDPRTWQGNTSTEGSAETAPEYTKCSVRTPVGINYNLEAYAKWIDEPTKKVYLYGYHNIGVEEDDTDNEYQDMIHDSEINFFESTVDNIVYWYENAKNVTDIKPLDPKKGFAICFKNDNWEYVEDHRGETVWFKSDGRAFVIKELGEIPIEYTTVAPPSNVQYYKFDSDNWILDDTTKPVLITACTTKKKALTQQQIIDDEWNNLSNNLSDEESYTQQFQQDRFTLLSQAKLEISEYPSKTMEELINILNNTVISKKKKPIKRKTKKRGSK